MSDRRRDRIPVSHERELSSSTSTQCHNCQTDVSPAYVRVFADNEGRLRNCPNCGRHTMIDHGAGLGGRPL